MSFLSVPITNFDGNPLDFNGNLLGEHIVIINEVDVQLYGEPPKGN